MVLQPSLSRISSKSRFVHAQLDARDTVCSKLRFVIVIILQSLLTLLDSHSSSAAAEVEEDGVWDGGAGDSDRSSDRGGSGSYNASRYVERTNSKSQSTPLHSHRRWAAGCAAVDFFTRSLL